MTKTSPRSRLAWLVPIAVLGLSATAATPAIALAVPAPDESSASACWSHLDADSGRVVDSACAADENALERTLRSDHSRMLVDTPADAARFVTAQARDASIQATYTLAVAYRDKNYTAQTHRFTTSISTTCKTHSFGAPWLSNLRWSWPSGYLRNQIQSVRVSSGCKFQIYADAEYKGSGSGYSTSRGSLGDFDNYGNSIRFSG